MDVRYWDYYDADAKELHKYREFAGLVERLEEEPESRDSFPAIAAHNGIRKAPPMDAHAGRWAR